LKTDLQDAFMQALKATVLSTEKDILLVSKDKASADAFIKKMQQPGPHMIQVPRRTKIHQYRPQTIIYDNPEEAFEQGKKLGEHYRRKDDPDYYEDHEIQPPNLTDYEQVELE